MANPPLCSVGLPASTACGNVPLGDVSGYRGNGRAGSPTSAQHAVKCRHNVQNGRRTPDSVNHNGCLRIPIRDVLSLNTGYGWWNWLCPPSHYGPGYPFPMRMTSICGLASWREDFEAGMGVHPAASVTVYPLSDVGGGKAAVPILLLRWACTIHA